VSTLAQMQQHGLHHAAYSTLHIKASERVATVAVTMTAQ
jgi:hypothetical protein